MLLYGARTGYKNPHSHCYMRPVPALTRRAIGKGQV
ncbi:hypothetical protein [Paenibacillus graminis]|nr:hypothetical protein [Paenibacillus graminis]